METAGIRAISESGSAIGTAGEAVRLIAYPISGDGLSTGFADVLALADELKDVFSRSDFPAALRRYEQRRLSIGRTLVIEGRVQMTRALRPV